VPDTQESNTKPIEVVDQSEDTNFHRNSQDSIYAIAFARGVFNPLRKERIKEQIEFVDVVADLTGLTGSKISCPFHGRDSTPSFTFYRRSNDAFCFGCVNGYYDSIKFVQEYLGITWMQAVVWLEQKWNLPPLEDLPTEEAESEKEVEIQVNFSDLQQPFLSKISSITRAAQNYSLSMEYIRLYFAALELEDEANRWKKDSPDSFDTEEAERMKNSAAQMMAKVLGQETVNRIILSKINAL
jgi:CHC2 zinc finger